MGNPSNEDNIPSFVVDENSDPAAARLAIKEMRRMIRLGEMARVAYQHIKQHGFYDGIAPVINPPSQNWNHNRFGVPGTRSETKHSQVQFLRLPRRLSISRADLGDMSKFSIDFGPMNGKEIDFFINGPVAVQTVPGKPIYEIQELRREVGKIRINTGHISWVSMDGKKVVRVYKEMHYSGAKSSMEDFSKHVSRAFIECGELPPAPASFNKSRIYNLQSTVRPSAKTLDLQNRVWQWFLDDGHAERMFKDIHELVRVAEVMGK